MFLTVRVYPGSRETSVREEGGQYLVRVPAHPEAGKANAAMLTALAEHLGVPPSTLRIVHGSTSRTKMVARA